MRASAVPVSSSISSSSSSRFFLCLVLGLFLFLVLGIVLNEFANRVGQLGDGVANFLFELLVLGLFFFLFLFGLVALFLFALLLFGLFVVARLVQYAAQFGVVLRSGECIKDTLQAAFHWVLLLVCVVPDCAARTATAGWHQCHMVDVVVALFPASRPRLVVVGVVTEGDFAHVEIDLANGLRCVDHQVADRLVALLARSTAHVEHHAVRERAPVLGRNIFLRVQNDKRFPVAALQRFGAEHLFGCAGYVNESVRTRLNARAFVGTVDLFAGARYRDVAKEREPFLGHLAVRAQLENRVESHRCS